MTPTPELREEVARKICRAKFAKRQHIGACTLEERLTYAENHYWKECLPEADAAIAVLRKEQP